MMLVVEGFGVVFLRRADAAGSTTASSVSSAGHEAELVRALAPVEDVCVAIGLRPVDQRIGVVARAAAPAHRRVAMMGAVAGCRAILQGIASRLPSERDMLSADRWKAAPAVARVPRRNDVPQTLISPQRRLLSLARSISDPHGRIINTSAAPRSGAEVRTVSNG